MAGPMLSVEVRTALEKLDQRDLLAHFDALPKAPRSRLKAELEGLDWGQIEQVRKLLLAAPSAAEAARLEPAPSKKKGAVSDDDARAKRRGLELLEAGRVAVFVVAGGQGSRLGYEGPKGCFPASPVVGRTLFEIFAAKIRALRERHATPLPWYVMTSAGNHAQTVAYFEEKEFFGLPKEDVSLFPQDMLPAMSPEGRILLAAEDRLFLSPNGHGGALWALRTSGALEDMRARGVEEIFYFQVDNPLVAMADPVFVGHHALEHAQMSVKVVAKRSADEKVGVVGRIDGRFGVIEYSDLSPEDLEARDESGQLRFRDGNIAVHMLRRDFVESITEGGLSLPFHLARKKIQAFDPESKTSCALDGVKFETFVFDAMGRADRCVVLEVDRDREFAPIKNAEGEDSPESSQRAQTELFASWLEAAGVAVPRDAGGRANCLLDIDPAWADSLDALRDRLSQQSRLDIPAGGECILP
ncbi:MAG TPA: UDPGP type 1 family protein [Planctomycetes bacterium]|nr:UDPGP type 1 family protein [Planctomycetota bacterium]